MATYKASEPQKAKNYFVEPAVYEVEIRKAIETISIKSGNSMIKLTCIVIMPDGSDGPEIWDYLTFIERSAWRIDQFLAALEIAVIFGEQIDVDADKLIGRKAVCLIGEEEGDNNTNVKFNKIERWLFGEEKKRFLTKKVESLQVTKINSQQTSYQKPIEVDIEADGDEIPF